MALDMYCYQTKTNIESVDFECSSFEEICQWKKHEPLHNWMERLYFQKGGAKSSFNYQNLQLLPQDIQSLEHAVLNRFFLEKANSPFNNKFYNETVQKDDMIKIVEIKIAISKGFNVYYSSWR